VSGIKRHPWYRGFNWEALAAQALVAPIDPNLRSPTDCQHFGDTPEPVDAMELDTVWELEF
jgi:hypothetical protein